jgi:hypothetical protein
VSGLDLVPAPVVELLLAPFEPAAVLLAAAVAPPALEAIGAVGVTVVVDRSSGAVAVALIRSSSAGQPSLASILIMRLLPAPVERRNVQPKRRLASAP